MLILTAICFLVGAMLGFQFKVFILVPAVGLALAMVAFNGVAFEEGTWQLVGTMVVVATSLQLGYFVGGVLQFVAHATRGVDRAEESMPTATGVFPSGDLRNRAQSSGATGRFEASKQLRQA
jgi:hypothetical protein